MYNKGSIRALGVLSIRSLASELHLLFHVKTADDSALSFAACLVRQPSLCRKSREERKKLIDLSDPSFPSAVWSNDVKRLVSPYIVVTLTEAELKRTTSRCVARTISFVLSVELRLFMFALRDPISGARINLV